MVLHLTRMFSPRGSVFARFAAAREGAIAPIFALAAFGLVASIGAVFDFSSASKARAELQAGADNAALSLVMDRAQGLRDSELNDQAHRRLVGALPDRLAKGVRNVGVQAVGDMVEVKAEATIPLGLSGIMGKTELKVALRSVADYTPSGRSRKVEIAVVAGLVGGLAETGRMPALVRNLQAYVGRAQSEAREPDAIRLALVPYGEQVKLSTGYRAAPWLTFGGAEERPLLTSRQEQQAASNGVAAAKLMLKRAQLRLERTEWVGCVADRSDPTVIAFDAAVRHPAARCLSAEWHGPSTNVAEPLTAQFEILRRRIGGWRTEGCENTTLGLVWGAGALMPQGPFGRSAPFADAQTQKILILISSAHAAVSRQYGLCIGPDQKEPRLDPGMRVVCDRIRQMGIVVYAVNFVGGNREMLKACVGDGKRYLEAKSVDELSAVMTKLADETLSGGPKVARLIE